MIEDIIKQVEQVHAKLYLLYTQYLHVELRDAVDEVEKLLTELKAMDMVMKEEAQGMKEEIHKKR